MRTRVLAASLSCFALTACPDDETKGDVSGDSVADTGGDASGDTGGDTSPTDTGGGSASFDDRYAAAICAFVATCLSDHDTTEGFVPMLVRDVTADECKAWVRRVLLDREGHDAGIASGAYTVNEPRFASCLAAIASTCGDEPPGACHEVLEGKVPAGGDCASSNDCAGDAFCDDPDGCGGTCVARGGSGADCDSTDHCSSAAAPLACSSESSTCVPVDTASNAAEGQACGEVHGATKVTLTTCATGLVCEGEECRAIVPAGGACTGDRTPCERGNVCWPDPSGGEIGTCRAIDIADEVGADCHEEFGDEAAVYCNVALFLGCKDGQCARIGDGSEGSTCFTNQDPDVPCDQGLYCDGAAFACKPLKPEGAPCGEFFECASDNCDVTCKPSAGCP